MLAGNIFSKSFLSNFKFSPKTFVFLKTVRPLFTALSLLVGLIGVQTRFAKKEALSDLVKLCRIQLVSLVIFLIFGSPYQLAWLSDTAALFFDELIKFFLESAITLPSNRLVLACIKKFPMMVLKDLWLTAGSVWAIKELLISFSSLTLLIKCPVAIS